MHGDDLFELEELSDITDLEGFPVHSSFELDTSREIIESYGQWREFNDPLDIGFYGVDEFCDMLHGCGFKEIGEGLRNYGLLSNGDVTYSVRSLDNGDVEVFEKKYAERPDAAQSYVAEGVLAERESILGGADILVLEDDPESEPAKKIKEDSMNDASDERNMVRSFYIGSSMITVGKPKPWKKSENAPFLLDERVTQHDLDTNGFRNVGAPGSKSKSYGNGHVIYRVKEVGGIGVYVIDGKSDIEHGHVKNRNSLPGYSRYELQNNGYECQRAGTGSGRVYFRNGMAHIVDVDENGRLHFTKSHELLLQDNRTYTRGEMLGLGLSENGSANIFRNDTEWYRMNVITNRNGESRYVISEKRYMIATSPTTCSL